MKLNPKKLSIAMGFTWGLYVLTIGWTAAIGWGNHELVNALAGLYIGFKASFMGGIVGAFWGVIDGLIAGYLVAVVYNGVSAKSK